MVSFFTKQLKCRQSVAEMLKCARTERGYSVCWAEKCTGINKKYLIALENGDYSVLPGNVYARGYVRQYGEFLKADLKKLMELYRDEEMIFNNLDPDDGISKPTRKINKTSMIRPHNILKAAMVSVVLVFCLGYIGYQVYKIFTPPFLVVNFPENNLVTSNNILRVAGQTEKEVRVSINDMEILSDRDGTFKKEVILHEGINQIKIAVQKKHSRQNVEYRNILMKESDRIGMK